MTKAIIGISASILIDNGDFAGYRRIYVNEDYADAVIKAGATPLVLSINDEDSVIDEYINIIDGLILSGGHDVDPRNYEENPNPKLGQVLPERDSFDLKLLKKAKEKNIPILGICRGFQLINVSYGGSLWQDLSYSDKEYIKHNQVYGPDVTTHTIKVEEDTKLHKIVNKDTLSVNSFHHQIIKDLGQGLKLSAQAPDGVVEAFEDPNYRFLLGVQFHPEMLHRVKDEMQNIFNELVKEAIKKR
ncbi:gamma-glutamyl-gamma-aminobutyrate hydrolase family protein [uncultured Helcococcus sp.]|uniref:gamma-glutamyl-gamma-aminobutyrate hydrolase family protein n=1 Tax=uncultured Helcococcus sp. TaxID=1072508 RepID=UPI00288A2FD5|nr:gamma-glutamyl-gamma-aminobutyrate hydrolase family protein [uncultured Helcococcus sp.]